MGGDKIVLLDGAGANGGGAATNGLLSMIPGMFANLIGGNKMDPNLVAALMNGRNNQDGFGGANGWWLWIIVLFWLWGGRGFGNGFGNGGDCCANGLPAQLNNDYGRELLMQAIQGNRSAIDQIASALNCSTTQLQNAICNVQGAIDKDPAYQKYVDTYGYHFSNALADEAVKKMVNVDGSKRIWKQPEIKDIFEKCGAKKPDKATWGDVQYVFAMYYSDGFPKVFKCENELVKATLMYLDDPDAPEGVAFIRWLAVQDYLGEKINWKDLT